MRGSIMAEAIPVADAVKRGYAALCSSSSSSEMMNKFRSTIFNHMLMYYA